MRDPRPQAGWLNGLAEGGTPIIALRRHWLVGCVLSGLLAVSGCSTVPRALGVSGASPQERVSGRLGVQIEQDAQRSFSAGFELTGSAETGELSLTSPLGTRLAYARWRPDDVVLETSEGSRLFPDLDALASEMFKEPIPLRALVDWLKGRPWPGAVSTTLQAPAVGFTQLGWDVMLDRYADGLLVATRRAGPAVSVRARVDRP